MFRGALVDISKLMSQLERSDKARLDTEACMMDLKSENNKLSEKNSKCNSTIKHLNSELREYKDKLKSSEDALIRTTVIIFHFFDVHKITHFIWDFQVNKEKIFD